MVIFSPGRRLLWWTAASAIGLVAATIIGFVLYVEYAFEMFGACTDTVLASVPSPNKARAIVVFRKSCGATVSDTISVSIASGAGPFASNLGTTFFTIADTPEVLSSWRGNNVVEIALIPGGGKILKRDLRVGDIVIAYK